MTTPVLSIPEVAQGQSNKEATINDAIRALEAAANKVLTTVVTGNVSVSSANATRYFVHKYTGTAGPRTISFPAKERALFIRNDTNGALLIQVTGGAGVKVTVAVGEGLLAYTDGTDFFSMAGGASIDASDVAFTPVGAMVSTDVQNAIYEAYSNGGGGGGGGGEVEIYPKPVASDFTPLLSSGTTGALSDSVGGARGDGVLMAVLGASGDRNLCAEVASPGSTFQVDARLLVHSLIGQYRAVSVYAKDGTGKLHAFGFGSNIPGYTKRFVINRWTTISAYSTGGYLDTSMDGVDVFVRLTKTASNLEFYVSLDGLNYSLVNSVSATAFLGTITNVGIMFTNNQDDAPQNVYDYVTIKEFRAI